MASSSAEPKWQPLENSPETLNSFIHKSLGVAASVVIEEVLSLDEMALDWVSRPVLACLFVFPFDDSDSSESEGGSSDEQDSIDESAVDSAAASVGDGPFFLKQLIGNACGTVALLHAMINVSKSNADLKVIEDGSWLSKYVESTTALSPLERGEYLISNFELEEAHAKAVEEGETRVPEEDEDVNLHFICFAEHDGDLYEFDGRQDRPIVHKKADPDFFKSVVKIVQEEFISGSEDLRFSLLSVTYRQEV